MSESGYRAAKQELINEYGDPYVLSGLSETCLIRRRQCRQTTWHRLKHFVSSLRKCRCSMSSLRHLAQLNPGSYLQKIVAKLSPALHGSWRKTVNRNRRDATFGDLVNFIEQHVRIPCSRKMSWPKQKVERRAVVSHQHLLRALTGRTH